MGLITGLAIAAAATAGAAAAKASAAKKAAKAQAEAIKNVKGVDIAGMSDQAKQADIDKYKTGFDALNAVDPVTGKIREDANAGLLKAVNDPNDVVADSLIQQLFKENANESPADKAFRESLKARAQQELDLGGSLSPEQQSEFVRAGLTKGAQTGVSPGSGAGQQIVGKLLASEQLAVQRDRENAAKSLFGFATDLNSTRMGNLSSLSNLATNTSAARASKLLNIAALADSRVPDIGLGGGDVANLAVANNNTENAKTLGIGQTKANSAVANGQLVAGLIGAAGQFFGGLNGGTAAGSGGAATKLLGSKT